MVPDLRGMHVMSTPVSPLIVELRRGEVHTLRIDFEGYRIYGTRLFRRGGIG